MTTKNKKPNQLTQALLETADDMKRAGIMDEEAYGKITNRHLGIKDNSMLPKSRRPTPPGEILRYEFLKPLGLSQKELAEALGITRVRLSEILRGRRSITADTAFRLARFFDTTPEFWLGLQMDIDLWETLQAHAEEYKNIKPLKEAA
jgi:antitoxin HigA-1